VTSTTGKVLPGRAPGLHLSDVGEAQATAVAARIAPLRPRAIYASPLERTRETARPIAAAIEKKIQVNRGLLECDFGSWTGKSLATLSKKAEWRQVQDSPSTFRFPEGESFSEMQERMWSTLHAIAERHRGGTVVAVSHADPIKAAVSMAQGVPLDLFQRTVISPCSVSAIVLGGGRPMVLCVNSLSQLTELRPS
jgi:probable phosphoglycerate mutase